MFEPQEKFELSASIIVQYNINTSLEFIYKNVDRNSKFSSRAYQYIFRTSLEYWVIS